MNDRPQADSLVELEHQFQQAVADQVAAGEQLVFGEGPSDASLMLIGEAPGRREAATGRPFVGAAGTILDEALRENGLAREQIYITNILKTRPPANRKPRRDEIQRQLPYLLRQIQLVKPLRMALLGTTAVEALTGSGERISRLRGGWSEIEGIPALITYHPAAALRDPRLRRALAGDLRQLTAAPAPVE